VTFWPRSLVGRNLVMLVSLTIASQLCAIFIFVWVIQRPRVDVAAGLEASQIMLVGRLLSAVPPAERQRQLAALNGAAVAPPSASPPPPLMLAGGYFMQRFITRLRAQLPPDVLVRWDANQAPSRLWVRLRTGDGEAYWVTLPAAPLDSDFVRWSVLLLLLSQALLPMLGAWLIHRRTQRPLQRLARAAGSVEQGAWPAPVPLDGPLELATVAAAFNRMLAALAELESSRAAMLAGISHDIRTPLTKLRMAVNAPEAFEAPQASAERFIDEIDVVLGQFIDFARGDDGEAAVAGDLNDLIEQLAGGYASIGHNFTLALAPLPPLLFGPVGLQRLLMNLMQNAALYGGAGLAVRSWRDTDWAWVAVEDRGPGVPAAQLARMKQPFRRGEQSGATAGTGLGLAIADRIARHGGGQLELTLRRGGGLRAVLRLPLAPPSPGHLHEIR
jgi:two-component system osmolarity sensor histidine kinase EnvZ